MHRRRGSWMGGEIQLRPFHCSCHADLLKLLCHLPKKRRRRENRTQRETGESIGKKPIRISPATMLAEQNRGLNRKVVLFRRVTAGLRALKLKRRAQPDFV